MLASQQTAHGQIAAGAELGVLLLGGNVGIELHVFHGEQAGLVNQGAVDAAMVRTFHMAELVVACFQGGLGTEVGEHLVVLHLTQADDRTTHAGQRGGGHIAQGMRHVMELMTVFQAVPMVGSIGKELVIVLAYIVTRVEQVFLIVEAYGVNRELLLR